MQRNRGEAFRGRGRLVYAPSAPFTEEVGGGRALDGAFRAPTLRDDTEATQDLRENRHERRQAGAAGEPGGRQVRWVGTLRTLGLPTLHLRGLNVYDLYPK